VTQLDSSVSDLTSLGLKILGLQDIPQLGLGQDLDKVHLTILNHSV
jgi:hypothetical protein